MDDYISRQMAREVFLRHLSRKSNREQAVVDWHYVKVILGIIPAADVRPVKEGRWVKARGSWCTPGGDPVWECSECGKGVHVYGIEHGTYGSDIADGQWVSCPNCGAKMGGSPRE